MKERADERGGERERSPWGFFFWPLVSPIRLVAVLLLSQLPLSRHRGPFHSMPRESYMRIPRMSGVGAENQRQSTNRLICLIHFPSLFPACSSALWDSIKDKARSSLFTSNGLAFLDHLVHSLCTESYKMFFLGCVNSPPRGGITQPRKNLFGVLCTLPLSHRCIRSLLVGVPLGFGARGATPLPPTAGPPQAEGAGHVARPWPRRRRRLSP